MHKKNNGRRDLLGVNGIITATVLALVLFVIYVILVNLTSLDGLITGIVVAAVYIALVAGYSVYAYMTAEKIYYSSIREMMGSIMTDTVSKLELPVIILDSDGEKVIWYNKKAGRDIGNGRKMLNGNINDYLVPDKEDSQSVSEKDDVTEQDNDPDGDTDGNSGDLPFLMCGETVYSQKRYDIKTSKKKFVLIVLTDETELSEEARKIRGEEPVIAYIVVDNLEDLQQFEQYEYKAAAAEVEVLLTGFAEKAGGVLKEYQPDRYLFLFTVKKLNEFVEDRFSLLDDIRNIKAGDSKTPVTVSIGVSRVHGSFFERDKAAREALEMALQRGGDQAVVKADDSLDIYGGKTKTVQKRTKVRARIVANEILNQIKSSSNVLIMAHKFADYDAYGAEVGIFRLALTAGARVNIVTDFTDTNGDLPRSWLKGIPDYDNIFINRDDALDLVQPDTLLIIVDVNNPQMFESPALADSCRKIVIIDHHRKMFDESLAPVISYIEPNAAAASELVAEMLEQILPSDKLLTEEADLLMSGIMLDTKQFSKNTGSRTFSAAMYLRNRGADVAEVQEFFKTSIEDYEREAKFLANIVVYRKVTAISLGTGNGDAHDRIVAAKAADNLLTVEGVQASFALIAIGDAIHISARSAGKINVQLILESLKGGGHYDSAGTQIAGATMQSALVMLKGAIDKYLDER